MVSVCILTLRIDCNLKKCVNSQFWQLLSTRTMTKKRIALDNESNKITLTVWSRLQYWLNRIIDKWNCSRRKNLPSWLKRNCESICGALEIYFKVPICLVTLVSLLLLSLFIFWNIYIKTTKIPLSERVMHVVHRKYHWNAYVSLAEWWRIYSI